MNARKRGLGRGLDALLGSTAPLGSADTAVSLDAGMPLRQDRPPGGEGLVQLPVEFIRRGRFQPRRHFAPEALDSLASSIRAQGIMQPLVVRRLPGETDAYELIAGERRWRASQRIGLESVPCMVREIDDQAALAMALVENLQREDLNPIEEAAAMQRLQEEFDLTHEAIAEAVGKSRVAVTNALRLLRLEPEVRALLERGELEMGHARALLGVEGAAQARIAHETVNRNLTVRQVESMVREENAGAARGARSAPARRPRDPDVARLEEQLAEHIGLPATLEQGSGGKGRLVLRYSNVDELEGALARIGLKEREK